MLAAPGIWPAPEQADQARHAEGLLVLLRAGGLLRPTTLPIVGLAVIAGAGGFWLLIQLDPLFREAVAPWRTPAVRAVMGWVTTFGQGWVLGVAALVMALVAHYGGRRDLVRAGIVAVPALIASGLVSRVIKIVVARPRPRTLEDVDSWWPSLVSAYHSFPSGHATSAFTLAAVLAVAAPSGRWVYYALAGLIALSRVALDAHFVSDVVAGGLLGWATGRAAMIVADRRWPVRGRS
jgi:membrane-associated phospholipid phosphatase